MPRDSQRSKVYNAERLLEGFYDKDLPELEQVETYIKWVWSHSWLKQHFKIQNLPLPSVRDGKGCRRAYVQYGGATYGGSITLPRWSRTKYIVIHELAHIVTSRLNWEQSQSLSGYWDPGHGWLFCRTYIDMVGHYIGSKAARMLLAAFRVYGVRYSSKHVSPTEEDKQLVAERVRRMQLVEYNKSKVMVVLRGDGWEKVDYCLEEDNFWQVLSYYLRIAPFIIVLEVREFECWIV